MLAVEVEEIVCKYTPANNGAGPLWCYGAPLLVRIGNEVLASIIETIEDIPPLCNTRWRIWRRSEGGWEVAWREEVKREREPCPLGGYDGKLYLSVNPSLTPPGTQYKECDPHILEFDAYDPGSQPKKINPPWPSEASFTDHSYRGFAVDRESGAILALNIDAKTGVQHWAYRDGSGRWLNTGLIRFPIRACYPQVALKKGKGYVLAIGDIIELNKEWRRYKWEKTGRKWDYVFRRLFFAWNPDLSSKEFHEPIEVDNVDDTGGFIKNLDLWVDEQGKAHILYLKRPVLPILRDKFFPNMPITTSLEYSLIEGGKVMKRETLIKGGEGLKEEAPEYGRLHATEDGRLLMIYYADGGNKLMQIIPEKGEPVEIQFKKPFRVFFTNTERGGSKPSGVIDLFGISDKPRVLRYARIALKG